MRAAELHDLQQIEKVGQCALLSHEAELFYGELPSDIGGRGRQPARWMSVKPRALLEFVEQQVQLTHHGGADDPGGLVLPASASADADASIRQSFADRIGTAPVMLSQALH